jgi:hypothetical protein
LPRQVINQMTVANWRKRTWVTDLPNGPKDQRSTVMIPPPDEQAHKVAFRRYRLLALNDRRYAAGLTMRI